MTSGFLGLGGTFRADVNLSLQLAMGVALLAGMALARAGRYRAHRWCQTSVVLLNLLLIAGLMAPSFEAQVRPHVREAASLYFAVPLVHAALGTLAECLGIYVILVAGTRVVPRRLRFRRFRIWMRATLAVWWIVIALGAATYAVWYRETPAAVNAVPRDASPRVEIATRNFVFEPAAITVTAGTTIEWTDTAGRHTVDFDDGSFTSPELVAGARVSRTFDTPGAYAYRCRFHGAAGMTGTVVVTPR